MKKLFYHLERSKRVLPCFSLLLLSFASPARPRAGNAIALSSSGNPWSIAIKPYPTNSQASAGLATPGRANKPVAVVKVSGRVTNDASEGLPGVSVLLKGTTNGTTTDSDGRYALSLPDDQATGTLVFSFVGYTTEEVAVGNRTTIDVQLLPDVKTLGEVVVTALGIEKQAQTLTYSTQKVAGADLKVVPQTNAINSLSGRVAGLNLTRSAAGLGGSVKVLLRGFKSIQGNNQPLYVVDGIPVQNFRSENTGGAQVNSDSGDGISNLNPDDIEAINVLKGPSAASLYGSQAANGVILITTKKGKAGVSGLNFNSSLTLDQVAYTPKLQNAYGQTAPDAEESWGERITNPRDNVSEFFQTGRTWVNAVNFTAGSQLMQSYLSYANTSADGILPGNTLGRHNFTFRQTAHFLKDKLKLDANLNYITQRIRNNPIYGYQSGPLYGLYTFPRGLDITPYRENYGVMDPVRNLETQNWPFISSLNQNPYWVIRKIQSDNRRNRVLLNLLANYSLAPGLSVQLRGNVDKISDIVFLQNYAGTRQQFAGANGGFTTSNITTTQHYGDAILNYDKAFGALQLNAVIGTSITDSRQIGAGSASTALYIPNVFTLQNMDFSSGTNSGVYSASERHQQLQAVFGNVSTTFGGWVTLDLTGRNDWSSNLSFTPNGSYFYPSAGLNLLLHEKLKLPALISFAKLRGSYAIVGNTVPLYVTNPLNYLSARGNILFNNSAPFTDLKPEKTRSLELGTELRFLQNQFSLDFTYYKTNTINQFFSVLVPPGTGYSTRFINAGNVQNAGVEVVLGYATLPRSSLNWNSSFNFTANRNKVLELAEGIEQFLITDDVNNYSSILKVGGSYGDIYGQVLKRDDQGRVVLDQEGKPLLQGGGRSLVGNANPRVQLGWNNTLSYKNFSFNLLVDGRFGGKVMSLTEQILDGHGVSKASGDARDNGGVAVNGVIDGTETTVTKADPLQWYSVVGGRSGVTGEYMYDATTVRLREASLSYSLPKPVLKNGFVKNLQVSLIGRNLAYFYKPAPFDPEIGYSTGNGWSGVDIFSLPATRSVGVSLNASF